MVTARVGLAAYDWPFGHWLQGNRQYATKSSARNTRESQSIVPRSGQNCVRSFLMYTIGGWVFCRGLMIGHSPHPDNFVFGVAGTSLRS